MTQTMTHPDTAWLVNAVPMAMTMAVLLLMSVVLRGRLLNVIGGLVEAQTARRRPAPVSVSGNTLGIGGLRGPMTTPDIQTESTEDYHVDPYLLWAAPIAKPETFLVIQTGALLVILLVLSQIAPTLVALLLAAPAFVLLVWVSMRVLESRYVNALDRALVPAVGRLGSLLQSANSLQRALEIVTTDIDPATPLGAEWHYLLDKLNTPMTNGMRANFADVLSALAAQTPSRRHRAFLMHVEAAYGQPVSVMTRRVNAAYEALEHAERRKSAASTELSQMRYGGFAIGGAGLFMAAYLAWAQQERFWSVYTGTVGTIVGIFMLFVLVAPLVVGILLSQAEDIDY